MSSTLAHETHDTAEALDVLRRLDDAGLVDLFTRLRHPTTGTFAAALWLWLSGPMEVPRDVARARYRMLGYRPFMGYPLSRAGGAA
jgi:hypothetical protein